MIKSDPKILMLLPSFCINPSYSWKKSNKEANKNVDYWNEQNTFAGGVIGTFAGLFFSSLRSSFGQDKCLEPSPTEILNSVKHVESSVNSNIDKLRVDQVSISSTFYVQFLRS
jgi:hypothetical protein